MLDSKNEKLQIKFSLDEGAYAPECAHAGWDAGWDLRSREPAKLWGEGSYLFDTGVHVEIPKGYVGILKSKSGLYVNHYMTSTGVVDAGFSGSIKVRVTNHSEHPYVFEKGDKVTQLVILPLPDVEFVQVDKVQGGERGDSGYGSTGR